MMKSKFRTACQTSQNKNRNHERNKIQLEFDYALDAVLIQTRLKPLDTHKSTRANKVHSGED